MATPLSNLKVLKAEMEALGWTISCFRFLYRGILYIVLVKLYLEGEAKPDRYTLVKIHFMRADKFSHEMEVAANSCRLYLSGGELRRYFDIQPVENLGDLFSQFYNRLGAVIPTAIPESYAAEEKAAMIHSLSKSDSEDPQKIYCHSVRRNPPRADGTPGQRSAFNTDKTKLLRPDLYEALCTDKTISFCYSTDPQMERDKATILLNWTPQNET